MRYDIVLGRIKRELYRLGDECGYQKPVDGPIRGAGKSSMAREVGHQLTLANQNTPTIPVMLAFAESGARFASGRSSFWQQNPGWSGTLLSDPIRQKGA
jgi:hypothetical protein